MTTDLSIAALRASGLPVDWMTVYVAWRNDTIEIDFSVLDADVQNLALDALSACALSDENALFRIADDTSRNRYDINYYLRQFAEKSGVSETDALRKWRCVFAADLMQRPLTKRHDWEDSDSCHQMEEWDYSWSLDYALSKWELSPPSPKVGANTQIEFERNFIAFRAWLEREKAELMQMPSVKAKDSPVLTIQ